MSFEKLKNLLTLGWETTNNARLTSNVALPKINEETEHMATPQPADLYTRVLRTLAEHKAVPFLALCSLVNSEDEELEEVVERMQKEGVVKVIHPDDASEKIVTLKHKGFFKAASN